MRLRFNTVLEPVVQGQEHSALEAVADSYPGQDDQPVTFDSDVKGVHLRQVAELSDGKVV